MGTIDFARGRDNPAMVPAIVLCLVLPALVASDGHVGGGGGMQGQMQQMMQMMQMANMMKGWGWGGEAPKQEQAKEWYNAQSTEDYEAYLKWCEENKQRQEEKKKERMEDEKEEREKSMMAQWKNWEKQLS